MFDRIEKFIGIDNLVKIKNTTVVVVGLGGVGGYAVESLVRSGIENIIVVDYDKIDISNINRQIIADVSNLGKLKTDEVDFRIKKINPLCNVIKLNLKLNIDNIDILFDYKFDYLIDCCDTVVVKQELIKKCLEKNISIISCMGTGNKINPSMLEIIDIRKTSYDPIAKKIRKYVNDNKIKGDIPVVYSKEQNDKFKGDIPTMIFVPATAGILCANYVIKSILEK